MSELQSMIRRALYKTFGLIAEGKIRKLIADSHRPRRAQLDKLRSILAANSSSHFGKEHGFAAIDSISEYQRAVPIRDYEGFRPYIDRVAQGEKAVLTADEPLMFATTSGTTGVPKYIPITPAYMKEFRWASVVSGYHLLRAFPEIACGTTLSVVSPAEEGRTAGGIPYGAISGQLFQHEPFLIKKFISPIPYEVFLIRDYETRYYILLRLALVQPLSLFYTLNPSTISLLCRRLRLYATQLIQDIRYGTANTPVELSHPVKKAIGAFLRPDPKRADMLQELLSKGDFVPGKIWPTLSVVSCWTKAAASFYLADFPEHFGSVPVCDITYGASEGRGTVFMGPGKQMLALHSHFFEFIPEADISQPNPTILLADELKIGENYFILFTTSGGLYRYNINDVLKVTGFYNCTPMLEFQYKGGNVSSFTGEKITELQVTEAMTRTAAKMDAKFRFFTVIPQFRPEPHYQLWVEADGALSSSLAILSELGSLFDSEMCAENIEYKTKRESQRLLPVRASFLSAGTYESFRRKLALSGIADAQIKVSHLNPKAEAREYLEGNLVAQGSDCLEVICR